MAVPAALASVAIAAPAHADYVGTDILRNLQTGNCLDSNYNGNVCALPCNGGNYQNWTPIYEGQNASDIVLLQDAQTGLCIQLPGLDGYLFTAPCDAGNYYQRWSAQGSDWNDVSFLINVQLAPRAAS